MVFKEIRVFIEVDCFECELSEALSAVSIGARVRSYTTTAKFATSSILQGN